jgi:excisionase family DNA binding protein
MGAPALIDIHPAVTVQEAADILGVQTETVRDMIGQSELHAVHVKDGEYWVTSRDLALYLQEREQRARELREFAA